MLAQQRDPNTHKSEATMQAVYDRRRTIKVTARIGGTEMAKKLMVAVGSHADGCDNVPGDHVRLIAEDGLTMYELVMDEDGRSFDLRTPNNCRVDACGTRTASCSCRAYRTPSS